MSLRLVTRGPFLSILALVVLTTACPATRSPSGGDGDDDGDDDHGIVRETLCELVDCGSHGYCVLSPPSTACFCDPGYEGAMCENCAPGFAQGPDGLCFDRLVGTRDEPPGGNCEFGGVATDIGLDLDWNGLLDGAEITATDYKCNETPEERCPASLCGEHGVCVIMAESPGCLCNAGYQGDRCDTCADGFLARPGDGACVRPRKITDLRDETGNPACPTGSYAVLSGLDADFDSLLDLDEIQETASLCKVARAGNLLVTNQAELEALAGVTDVAGDLTIHTRYVETLAPLGSLVHVQGRLRIQNNEALDKLEGLGRLDGVGGLELTGNAKVTTTAGLDGLKRAGTIKIASNPALATVDLGPIGVVEGDLWLQGNPSLAALHSGALRSVTRALVLAENPMLSDLSGFSSLTAVGSEIWIEDNDALQSLSGFARLGDAGGLLVIGCGGLTSLELPALASLRGGLTLDDNDVLASLATFDALATIEGSVAILNHEKLSSIAGFPKLETVGGGLLIRNNDALFAFAGFPLLDSLGEAASLPASEIDPPTPTDTFCNPPLSCLPVLVPRPRGAREWLPPALEISDNLVLADVAGFDALTQLKALEIKGNAALTSLPFLAALERCRDLSVRDNAALKFVPDLDELEALDVLKLENNASIERGPNLSALTSLTASVTISGNPKYETPPRSAVPFMRLELRDLPAVKTLSGMRMGAATKELSIVNLDLLADLDGLGGLAERTLVSLRLEDNDKLVSLSKMGKLADVGSLIVTNNDSLVDLSACSELTDIVVLELNGNAMLSDLADLSELDSVRDSLQISANAKLPNCEAVALAARVAKGASEVADNDANALCD